MAADVGASPLRAGLVQELRDRIVSGTLAPGSRINESRLAAELRASRTPLREALMRLEEEGVVTSQLNRGFSVATLSAREARETYPMLWTLEALALTDSGSLARLAVPELTEANAALAAAIDDAHAAREADSRFHDALVARCPNRRLQAMVARLRRSVRRYEHLYMSDPGLIPVSVQQHAAIVAALAAGRLADARDELERNWRFGMDAVVLRLP